MNTHYLIIGASAAGLGAATKLRDLDPEATITVITAEAEMPYNRCLLADYLMGNKTVDGVSTKPQTFFDDKKITLMLNAKAVNLDATQKCVTLASGQNITYDKLFIGTGRSGWIPAIPGADGQGVFPFYDLRDTSAILSFIATHKPKHAVVVGGGLSGLECADALATQGLTVDIIQRSQQILPHQLDQAGADFLMTLMEKRGVRVHTGTTVKEIIHNNGSRVPCGPQDDKNHSMPTSFSKKIILEHTPCHPGAHTTCGSPGSMQDSFIKNNTSNFSLSSWGIHLVCEPGIHARFIHPHRPTDLIIFTLGGNINNELAVQANLTMHKNGIVVDEGMRTSDPNIFAGGDVCAIKDLLTGTLTQSCLWTDAVMQGLAAAYSMVGQQRKYPGTLVVTSSTIYGVTFVTCGAISNPPAHYTKTVETGEEFHHTYLFDGETLKGFALIGAVDNVGALRKRVMDGLN